MTTLEEIVKHVEYVVCHNNDKALVCMGIKEYRQLAELLRELQERRKAPEIIYCHECKHWKDSDGVYRRGISAESKCPVNSRQVYEGTFFCGMAERRTDENNNLYV